MLIEQSIWIQGVIINRNLDGEEQVSNFHAKVTRAIGFVTYPGKLLPQNDRISFTSETVHACMKTRIFEPP